jgi:CheY-like chemotaxis protein
MVISAKQLGDASILNATNIQTFITTTIESFRVRAEQSDLSFDIDIDESIPDKLQIDYRWFNGIIANILYDFIHNKPEGTIKLSIDCKNEKDLYIQALHSHYHISPNNFDSSTKHTSPTDYNVNLAISKQLVESLSGKIWVESVGKGSIIHIMIPVSLPIKRKMDNASGAAQQEHLNILLVEDNKASQTVIVKMLENLGHSTATAQNGRQALEVFDNNQFDLILMDINLPIMDGVKTTEVIRQLSDPKKANIPIIAITASSELNSDKWLNAGINSYILKPISLNSLNNTINSLFANLATTS